MSLESIVYGLVAEPGNPNCVRNCVRPHMCRDHLQPRELGCRHDVAAQLQYKPRRGERAPKRFRLQPAFPWDPRVPSHPASARAHNWTLIAAPHRYQLRRGHPDRLKLTSLSGDNHLWVDPRPQVCANGDSARLRQIRRRIEPSGGNLGRGGVVHTGDRTVVIASSYSRHEWKAAARRPDRCGREPTQQERRRHPPSDCGTTNAAGTPVTFPVTRRR